VLDEAHNLKEGATDFLDNYVNRILGLTGTAPRYIWSEKGQMMEKFYPIKYRYKIEQAISDDLINDYRIFVHFVELGTTKNIPVKTKTGNVFYQSEIDSYNYWSSRIVSSPVGTKDRQILTIMRMKSMMTFKSKEFYAKALFDVRCSGKSIIFCNTKEQAELMCTDSFYSGKPYGVEILDKFKQGIITKMACVLMLNEGENIPGLKNAVILHSYGNEKKLAQRLGRCLRLNPNDCSNIHIMCYKNTIDEKWVGDALEAFDSTKIKYLN
jgi:superfamily II DNA or RNA helicase